MTRNLLNILVSNLAANTHEEVNLELPVKIGTLRTNRLVLADKDVSRMHAMIDFEDHALVLRDLSSTAGTFVNSVRIGRAAIKYGDRITIGPFTLTIGHIMPEGPSGALKAGAPVPSESASPSTPPASAPASVAAAEEQAADQPGESLETPQERIEVLESLLLEARTVAEFYKLCAQEERALPPLVETRQIVKTAMQISTNLAKQHGSTVLSLAQMALTVLTHELHKISERDKLVIVVLETPEAADADARFARFGRAVIASEAFRAILPSLSTPDYERINDATLTELQQARAALAADDIAALVQELKR